MARYELFFKKSVTKDLRVIPRRDVKRILKSLETLANEPRGPGCKKLSGQNYYRIRLGNYRIIYEILDDRLVVHVVKVAHRSQACR